MIVKSPFSSLPCLCVEQKDEVMGQAKKGRQALQGQSAECIA
jgi:hypothetical protein